MKKRLLVLATIVGTIAMLSGCGDSETSENSSAEGETTNKVEAKENVMKDINTDDYVTTLGNYKGVEVSIAPVAVSEEEVDNEIKKVLESNAEKVEITDRVVENGDVVNIDYVGKKDDVAFEGGSTGEGGFDLTIGSNTFIEGFEEGILGAALNETLDLNLTFPEGYGNPDLDGADVVFTVTVNSIFQNVTPELTEELLVTIAPESKTVEAYRQSIRDLILENKNLSYENEIAATVFDAVIADSVVLEPPTALVDKYYQESMMMMETYASYAQQTVEEFVQANFGTTMEAFETDAQAMAVSAAKENLILRAIGKIEGLIPTEEIMNEFVEGEMEGLDPETSGIASVEDYIAQVGSEEIEIFLIAQKVLELFKAEAVITDTNSEEVTEEETTTEETVTEETATEEASTEE